MPTGACWHVGVYGLDMQRIVIIEAAEWGVNAVWQRLRVDF